MDFVTVFLAEARESLEAWERTALRYETGSHEAVDLDTLFRLAHNLKGSALTVGLEGLGKHLHRIEEILSALKARRMERSPDVVTLLLEVQGTLSAWIDGLRADAAFVPPGVETEAERLDGVLKSGIGGHTTVTAPSATAPNAGGPLPFADIDSLLAASESEVNRVRSNAGSASPGVPSSAKSRANGGEALAGQGGAVTAAPGPGAENTVLRVSLERLDALLNLIGELVVDQAIMQRHRTSHTTASPAALRTISHMGKTIQEIQGIAMALRMTPLESTFQKLQRSTRMVAQQLGKKVEVRLHGGDVELDKVIVDRLGEPLVHMVRNAVDHGIETAAERLAAGKSEVGLLLISARHKDDEVVITIADDGAGLDPEKLRAKAVDKGILSPDARLTREESFELIFHPGFTTKAELSEISGRGVGMDVVATTTRELKGAIGIESEVGRGTTFTLTLPLSLSIIEGLVVGVADQRYVVPLAQLVETIDTSKVRIETMRGKGSVIDLRGEVVPFLHTATLLAVRGALPSGPPKLGIVAHCRGRKIGFSVDSIVGQQSVVLKSLSRHCHSLPGILGGAILGDGEPALVLDLAEFQSAWSVKNASA